MLTRSFMQPSERRDVLAYSPMFHSRLFADTPKYRDNHFQALKRTLPKPEPIDNPSIPEYKEEELNLDGHPEIDRPLFVQFCSNDPNDFLTAARHVFPFCDAVDLNLGCPQGIAKRGNYGAFLQEDWQLIHNLISTLHEELPIPVTAKFRVQETREKTLAYARMILSAGASIITVHGRRREQKGHITGLADWSMIRFLRDNLPEDTVIFANGNILQHGDIENCLRETGADGVMSAEGNLYDPSIFATPPPVGQEGREYWRGRDGKGGYRMDAVMRRYMDIIHTHVLHTQAPDRRPLFISSDPEEIDSQADEANSAEAATNGKRKQENDGEQPSKKQRHSKKDKVSDPNLTAMQPHLFHLLRPLVAKHHNVRDALARSRAGDISSYENVLSMVEKVVKEGILEYERNPAAFEEDASQGQPTGQKGNVDADAEDDPHESSLKTVARCKRPWFLCQPYVRPLPKEAMEKGSIRLSKKDMRKLELEAKQAKVAEDTLATQAGLDPNGKIEKQKIDGEEVEVPREGMVCG